MKLKISSFLFAFLLFVANVQAQGVTNKATVQFGEEVKDGKRVLLEGVVHYADDGMYVIKYSVSFFAPTKYIIEKFDLDLKRVKSAPLIFRNKKVVPEYFVSLNGNLYVLFEEKDKDAKVTRYYQQGFDETTFKLKDEIIEISSIEYEKNRNRGEFYFEKSKKNSKLLIYNHMPYERKEAQKLGFKVFDKDFKLLWQKNVTMPYKDELFEVNEYQVDNAGNCYIIGKLYQEKKEARKSKRDKRPIFEYKILKYTATEDTPLEYTPKLNDHFITDIQISLDREDNIVCVGFYSEKGYYQIKGSFYLSIDKENKKIENQKIEEFEVSFMTETDNARVQKRAKKKSEKGKTVELYKYNINEIILKEKGGAVVVAEQYYMYEVVHHTKNGSYTTYHYVYGDIIVLNMDEKGNVLWKTKIPKAQHTVNDFGLISSYALTVVGDRLYFVFNDHPDNMTYVAGGKDRMKNFVGMKTKKIVTTLVEVDNKGKQTREMLYEYNRRKQWLFAQKGKQVAKNELMLYTGMKGFKSQFIRVKFK